MKCEKCNGFGCIRNPKRDTMSETEAWEYGFIENKKCPICGGSGFILGNYNEVVNLLNILLNTHKQASVRELKEIRNLICK